MRAPPAEVHSSCYEMLRKALAKNRDERYTSAREFAEAVKNAPAR